MDHEYSSFDTSPQPKEPRRNVSGFYLPPTVLDAFIPGYSFLADSFLHFGVDISFYVSLFALGLVCSAALRLAITPVWSWILNCMSSTVIIHEYDPIFDHVLAWIAAHKSLQNLRVLRCHSRGQYYDDSHDDNELEIQERLAEDTIFNFNDWAARAPLKYEPDSSSGYFWHNRHLFQVVRHQEKVVLGWSGAVRDRELLVINVLWCSTKPIKALIAECRELYLAKQHSVTIIRRPVSKEERGRRHGWHKVASRPSRSMTTVVLDDTQKVSILQDINDFLHPKTAKWYANRGIPYRRGYLFHGPPGTGKTSLSFALAGVFGLDIYCLSLSEVTLTEETLIMLFNTLPKRCIVLLEDIDSAGVSRPKPLKKKKKRKSSSRKTKSSKNAEKSKSGITKPKTVESLATKVAGAALKNANDIDIGENLINAISISGLLNAIDGVASQEGRVLIMTTNFPEKLDDALVRPGRVDLNIEFALANKQQLEELFLRMYCADNNDAVRQPTKISQVLPGEPASIVDATNVTKPKTKMKNVTQRTLLKDVNTPLNSPSLGVGCAMANGTDHLSLEKKVTTSGEVDIEALAKQFADDLPDMIFSPAEIQGYLVMKKKSPQQAVSDVVAWRDQELAKKDFKVEDDKSSSVNKVGDDLIALANSQAVGGDTECPTEGKERAEVAGVEEGEEEGNDSDVNDEIAIDEDSEPASDPATSNASSSSSTYDSG